VSLETARQGIVDALLQIPGLEVYGWPQQNANLPMVHVLCDEIDADFVMNDSAGRYRFIVRVFASRADQEQANTVLDPLVAPTGDTIRGIVNEDPTLNATVDSARVVTIRPDRVFDIGGSQLLGAEVELDVIG
jgi:hypothetical protein